MRGRTECGGCGFLMPHETPPFMPEQAHYCRLCGTVTWPVSVPTKQP